ncbi:MAG TPA: hypothetical protein VMT20_06120 [Terriglobia bacterium]|nr:hypothetical protein [Terriglobia bacterium]
MELQLAEAVVRAIATEYLQTAAVRHPPIHSAHEGAAILREKYDILWEEAKRLDGDRMRAAAVKLATTALRFVVETCPPTQTTDNGKWTRSRKALDPRREKEIEAFERWQMSVGEAGSGRHSLGRDEHEPQYGHPGTETMGCGARPRKRGCHSH